MINETKRQQNDYVRREITQNTLWIKAILKNYIQNDLIAHLQYPIPQAYGVS